MTLQQAIDVLREHNEWRMKRASYGKQISLATSEAIDFIIANLDGGLHAGDYPLAEGFTMYMSHRTIHVKAKVRPEGWTGDIKRCHNCKFREMGRCFTHRIHQTYICTKKPKEEGTFYAAPHSRKACDRFELKEK